MAESQPTYVPGSIGGFPDGSQGVQLSQQQQSQDSISSRMHILTIVIVAVVVAFVILSAFFLTLRRLRVRNVPPKYIPGRYLKRKYQEWSPRGYKRSHNRGRSLNSDSLNDRERGEDTTRAMMTTTTTAAGGLDRNTSIRSVITLPAYSSAPKESERVIGREGEREGVDMIVELPESQEEEEEAREAEMSSLFQIREARRQEIAERQARRAERQEALARGDWDRVRHLVHESRQRARNNAGSTGTRESDALIANLLASPRERRVSSVSYADIGNVRHDGSRVRGNSTASEERSGLLEGAAPMGDAQHDRNGSSASSLFTMNNNSSHHTLAASTRQRSASDLSSVSSVDLPQATPTTTNENSPPSNSPDSIRDTHTSTTDDRAPAGYTLQTRTSLPPNYDNIEWGEAPAYTEEEIRRRESQRLSRVQEPQTPRLNVPRITVQGASEPSSPAMGRVSEEYARL